MIIDEKVISEGITPELLAKLIERHNKEFSRYDKLRRYYEGEHSILERKQSSEGMANNRVVCNHAK